MGKKAGPTEKDVSLQLQEIVCLYQFHLADVITCASLLTRNASQEKE